MGESKRNHTKQAENEELAFFSAIKTRRPNIFKI